MSLKFDKILGKLREDDAPAPVVQTSGIPVVLDGGGAAITTGVKGFVTVPFACTITGYQAVADAAGSIVVDVWKDTLANYPPTDADSITASAPITLSTADHASDSTLTGWTKTLAAGDVLAFNVDSADTIKQLSITIFVTKS